MNPNTAPPPPDEDAGPWTPELERLSNLTLDGLAAALERPDGREIVVVRGRWSVTASLAGDPAVRCVGDTLHEAVGALVACYAARLGLRLTYPSPSDVRRPANRPEGVCP